MGGKASSNFQSDRPESGGADRDMLREKSGLIDRDRERYAVEQAERQASAREASEQKAGGSAGDDVVEPNPDSRDD